MSSASIFRSSTANEPRSLPSPNPNAQEVKPNSSRSSHCPSKKRHDDTYRDPSPPPIQDDQLASSSSCSDPSTRNPTPSFARFQSTTIAPSPPSTSMPFDNLHRSERSHLEAGAAQHGVNTNLRVATNITTPLAISPSLPHHQSPIENSNLSPSRSANPLNRQPSANSLRLLTRTPSIKAALTGSIGSIGSISGSSSGYPSPMIAAMGDMTPLPSPLLSGDSPGPWKKLAIGSMSPPQRRDKLRSVVENSILVTGADQQEENALTSSTKRKLYRSLNENNDASGQTLSLSSQQPQRHTRNRSISEYTPDSAVISVRQVTASGSHIKIGTGEPQIRREQNLAESRGLTPTVTQPPTPPPSESSRDSTEGVAAPRYEYFEARDRNDKKMRRWRSVCTVGQGTFSRVVLATSQMNIPDDIVTKSPPDPRLDRKTLVAVKVCEHGPRGGASEERVEMSLKRELEIMQSIHHPSLVDLKAWSIEPTRAILVLSYCPGGDLFDIATTHRKILTPSLTKRIFAELVGAVSYLHKQMIVHRDIKLENVLVNLTPDELADPSIDWATYPYSVIALADLGLSRRIAADEKLETRCGSEDYAAPEVIMGQPYDGRATDAWSLGVLLFALLESRLPFDPSMNESHRMRSRKSHRIARVEWRWFEYEGGDSDNDGSEAKFMEKGLLGAMHITEGLLKRARSRWTLDKVSAELWVREGITVEGGLRFREESEGAEV